MSAECGTGGEQNASPTAAPPVGDWLVVPGPAAERMWRWGRIVAVLDDAEPVHYRVRWYGDTHDTVVLAPPDARIESAQRWPRPGSGAIGLLPRPHHHEHPSEPPARASEGGSRA